MLVEVSVTVPSGYQLLTPSPLGMELQAGQTRRLDFALVSDSDIPSLCGSGSYGIVSGYVYSDTLSDGQFVIGIDQPTLTPAVVSVGSQTQSTNWAYGFTCVPSGSAVVTSTNPSGYTNTTPNTVTVNVPASGTVDAVNFGKAFESAPVNLYRVFVPIVRRE